MAGVYQRLKRSIKRSIGARWLSASSMRCRMRSMALLPGSDTTSRRSTRSAARLPAGTLSPWRRSTGMDSPVRALSSNAPRGSSRRASAGKRAPGAISMMSPGRSSSAPTSSRTSPSAVVRIRNALSGTSAIRAVTPARARPAA